MAEKTLVDLIKDVSSFQQSVQNIYNNRPDVKDDNGNSISPIDLPGAFTTLKGCMDKIDGSLSSEAAARAAADTTLQSNITAEATARAAADTALQNSINAVSSFKSVSKPETASSSGKIGEFFYESSPTPFLYLCVATNVWVRFEPGPTW